MKYFIYLLLISSTVLADGTVLEKGMPAPYDGVLLDQTSDQQARQAILDVGYYKELNDSKSKIINEYKSNEDIYTQRLNNYSTQNDALAKELQSSHVTSDLVKIGYFTVGFGLAVGAAYIVSKVK